MGFLYYQGFGIKADDHEACYWFRLAAEQGSAQAQYNLGVMYEQGRGTVKSLPEAKRWYALAAAQAHSDAKERWGDLPRTNAAGLLNFFGLFGFLAFLGIRPCIFPLTGAWRRCIFFISGCLAS